MSCASPTTVLRQAAAPIPETAQSPSGLLPQPRNRLSLYWTCFRSLRTFSLLNIPNEVSNKIPGRGRHSSRAEERYRTATVIDWCIDHAEGAPNLTGACPSCRAANRVGSMRTDGVSLCTGEITKGERRLTGSGLACVNATYPFGIKGRELHIVEPE